MSNWRDPSWRNLKDVIDGLEGDTRDARAGLFGENVIEIEEKPILKLLIDEVPQSSALLMIGTASVLHFSSLFDYSLVNG
jgi:cation-transporting P-type ATPase 13A2